MGREFLEMQFRRILGKIVDGGDHDDLLTSENLEMLVVKELVVKAYWLGKDDGLRDGLSVDPMRPHRHM